MARTIAPSNGNGGLGYSLGEIAPRLVLRAARWRLATSGTIFYRRGGEVLRPHLIQSRSYVDKDFQPNIPMEEALMSAYHAMDPR